MIIDGVVHEVETSLLRDYESIQSIIERKIEKGTDKFLNWFYKDRERSTKKLALFILALFVGVLAACIIHK